MKKMTPEKEAQIKADWAKKDHLKDRERLKIVSELNGCSQDDVMEVLQLERLKAYPNAKRGVRYDQNLKDAIVKGVLEEGKSRREMAERFGVTEASVSKWVAEAQKNSLQPEEVKTQPEEVKTEPEEVKTEPEEVKTEPEETKPASDGEASTSSASLRSAPSPQGEGFGGVDLKALAKAQEGLLDFADLYEEIGFLNAEQARKLCEMAEQADYYTEGIRWALERSKR